MMCSQNISFYIFLFAFFALNYFQISFAADNFSPKYCGGTNGWNIWKGNCYKLFTMPESMTFPEAQKLCQQFDSNAASVHSDAENEFLAEMSKEAFALLETNVPIVNGQPLYWDRIHGGIWIGYRRQKDPNLPEFKCSWVDGTKMDYANSPMPDSIRQQVKKQSYSMGYPWEGPNPDDADVSIAVCGAKKCAGDSDQCVEMLNWPGSKIGTWNDLSCKSHKLSGVFCKKPISCE